MSLNKVMLIGRLGKDPEVRVLQSGKTTCSFSLATSESWTKDGRKEERTEWHRIVMWDKMADLAAKYLTKGKEVYLEGKLQTRSWDDQSGQKKYATEVVVSNMTFIGSNSGGGQAPAPAQGSIPGSQESSYAGSDFGSDDDVPF